MLPAGTKQAVAQRPSDLAGAVLFEDAIDQMRLLAQIVLDRRAEQRGLATCVFEEPPLEPADAQLREYLRRQRRAEQLGWQRQGEEQRRARAGGTGLAEQVLPVERGAVQPQQLGDIA